METTPPFHAHSSNTLSIETKKVFSFDKVLRPLESERVLSYGGVKAKLLMRELLMGEKVFGRHLTALFWLLIVVSVFLINIGFCRYI